MARCNFAAARGFQGTSMGLLRLCLSLVSVFLALLPSSPAQEKTFSAEVKVVNVLATVRNNKGEVIRNLTKDDFTLEEEGRPQVIRYFSQESDLPLTLGLLVDTSMSQRRVLGEQRAASFRFLDQVLREDRDQAFLIHFDVDVELLQDLTSSRKELESALARLEMPDSRRPFGKRAGGGGWPPPRRGARGGMGIGTTLYDSVLLASEELMTRQRGRKAIIVLSDGVDMGSKVPLSEAIEAAQRADTLVYTIRFFDEDFNQGGGGRLGGRFPQERPDGRKVLQQIAKATGGGFFEVSKKQSIERIYKQLEEELRNQYNLGFTPQQSGATAGYRKLRLTTKQRGLVVQARDGYYLEP